MKDPISRLPGMTRRSGFFAGLLLLLPIAAAASEVRTTISPGEGSDLRELTDDAAEMGLVLVDGKVHVKLEDAVALTLSRNLSLVVERYRRSQAVQGIEEAFGIFDLNLGSTFQLSEDTSPVTSLLEDTADNSIVNENAVLNFNLAQLTAYGGTANLAFNNNRFASSNLASQPNPRFTIGLDVSFTQPLLRNFGRDVTHNNILVARNNSAISRDTFQLQVETIVQQVSDRYWLLVEAQEQLKVAEESLALAERLHEMNRIQVEVGTMAPLEMVQSEAGVATREEDIIRRSAAVEDSADLLRRFLNLDRDRYWDVDIVPVSDAIIDYLEIDLAAAYATALEKRTDVSSQRLGNDNRALQAELAGNQKKPRLDVSGGYGLNGVDGDTNFTDPSTGITFMSSGGYSDALDQILDAESGGWFVQAVFAYPVQNRAARARSVRAGLNVEQGEMEMRDLRQQVLLDVRRLTRAVRTAEKQIESAKITTKLQRRNLWAEEKRYENGLATSFQVLQIQEDLTEALSREVSAIANYRRAVNAFYFATGTILEQIGVELVDGEEAKAENEDG